MIAHQRCNREEESRRRPDAEMTGLAYYSNPGHGNASWEQILLGAVVVLIVWGIRWLVRRNRR
jgi:hypothetical protein